MIIALNQYWYLDLELDLPSTDIDLALSTGFLFMIMSVNSFFGHRVDIKLGLNWAALLASTSLAQLSDLSALINL